jgi:ATP diphosphatase
MIRRHPHVFGTESAESPDEVSRSWAEIKAQEKERKAARRGSSSPAGLLDDIPAALPALTRAVKLQGRASKVGFDWNDPRKVIEKIREELEEVERELDGVDSRAREGEIGDLFFAVANLARHLNVDPEQATRTANAKFMSRFAHIERSLAARGRPLGEASLNEMEDLWVEAKAAESDRG